MQRLKAAILPPTVHSRYLPMSVLHNNYFTGITTKNLITSILLIDVLKDFNIGNGDGKDDPDLRHLEQFHLVGPFGPEVTAYMIKGAAQLKNLALMINWIDPNFCSVQPTSDKDYLGIEYLKELLKTNNLKAMSELHLSARDRRSRAKLDKQCADFVLTTFNAHLRHLGYLGHWNIGKTDRWQLIEEAVQQNRHIVFDETLKKTYSRSFLDFNQRYVENRSHFSCQNSQSLISSQYNENNNGFMADLFEVIAGLHGFFEDGNNQVPPLGDYSDSEDSFDEDEDDDVLSDDDFGGIGGIMI